jgi:hypothetical protein
MARYYQNADGYLAGSLRIVSEYIEFFGSAKTCRGTFAEASALTAGTSHLASKYGIYRHVDPVIAIGDAVLAENTGVSGRDAVGFSIVANNLANLHIALAEDQPPAGTHHYGKALACGEAALVAIDAATGDDVQTLRETTLQKLTQLHVRLAMDDGDAGDHASQARRLAEEYASAAADRAAAVEWVARILEVLEANRSASSDAGYSTRAARRRVELSRAVERIGEWVQESEQRIAAAKDTSERVRIASETVGSVYDDLTAGLERVTSVSGFDWSVCKMLLALGAIASGRLGDLTEPLVRSWLTNPYSPHDTEPPTAFQARQYMITGGGKADPADAAGRIVGLAMLAEWVQRNATDLPFREMLRSHNSGLLTRIVVGRPVFQECSGPALSPEADVDALLRTVHGIFDRASTTRAAQSSEPLKPPAQPARMGNP